MSNQSSILPIKERLVNKLRARHLTNNACRSIEFVSALKMLHHLVCKARGRNRHCATAELHEVEETRRDVLRGDGSTDDLHMIVVTRQADGKLKCDNVLGNYVVSQELETIGYYNWI